MKLEIDSAARLASWLERPAPAVFQGQDLRPVSDAIAALDLRGCSFLGCWLGESLAAAAVAARCLVLPRVAGLPFDPFRPRLYTPDELYDRFDPDRPESQRDCFDWTVYESCVDPQTRAERAADLDTLLLRRIHDHSVSDALEDLLDEVIGEVIGEPGGQPVTRRLQAVAVMGGHDEPRAARGAYADVARMSLGLARAGYVILTGGGPGLMEAANLGAYLAGFADPEASLAGALRVLAQAPRYDDRLWLAQGYRAWKSLGTPIDWGRSRSVGMPTWFYGHEPPNVFATDIAKYFENSVREEGLLALALGGVVFARGNAGTVQEVFQDACQNYYRTYRGLKSPMILLGRDYWNPGDGAAAPGADARKPVYPLLRRLATEKHFLDYLLLTDDYDEVRRFLDSHRPVAG